MTLQSEAFLVKNTKYCFCILMDTGCLKEVLKRMMKKRFEFRGARLLLHRYVKRIEGRDKQRNTEGK